MNRKIHFAIFNSDLNKRFSYWAETLKAGESICSAFESCKRYWLPYRKKPKSSWTCVYRSALFLTPLYYIALFKRLAFPSGSDSEALISINKICFYQGLIRVQSETRVG